MKAIFLVGAAVLGFTGTTAQAQDVSGFRVEGRLGWERADAEAVIANPDDDEDEQGDEFLIGSDDDNGAAYGVELGYDAQLGESFVVGAYAGVDLSDSNICSELVEDDLACAELGRTFSLGVRAGVPIGKNSLIYAKGGYSNGKLDLSYDPDITDNDDDEPGEIGTFSEKRDGYHLGAGAEFGLTSSIYAKLEYVYTDFGGGSYVLDAEDEASVDVQSDRHQVFVGLGMRF
ncbi:porin family protein [Qipengyuania sp. GH25]|uniref:Porin family protein n=1 Tax=Qipengyuania pacifica TaxID=2860199 RepID=A0ABS7JKC6_9SPHN|nr:outer membrane beta-barrel protein [Qipengyuania aerophila]MBX7489849.1 porin family protein [Qipengyuania aerophila]